MEAVCLDADVLVEFSRRKLVRYVDRSLNLHISFITLYEFLRGLAYLGRDIVASKDGLESRFYVIWPSNDALMVASEIYSDLKRKGQLIPDPDILIGSMCIAENIPLTTFNMRHYKLLEQHGLRLITPEEVFTSIRRL